MRSYRLLISVIGRSLFAGLLTTEKVINESCNFYQAQPANKRYNGTQCGTGVGHKQTPSSRHYSGCIAHQGRIIIDTIEFRGDKTAVEWSATEP